jgi:hypothetical protein
VPTFADRGVAWSAQRISMAVNLGFLGPEPLLFHSSSSSVILTRLSGPRSYTSLNLPTSNTANKQTVRIIAKSQFSSEEDSAECSSKMLLSACKTMSYYNLEDNNLKTHHRLNLKSCRPTYKFVFLKSVSIGGILTNTLTNRQVL